MVKNFETETKDLNEKEQQTLLPLMVKSLKRHVGSGTAITNRCMREKLYKWGHKVSDARIRKLINHIRVHGLVECLIATNNGYYVTEDAMELKDYIYSLEQRVDAIMAVINCLKTQLEKLLAKKSEY